MRRYDAQNHHTERIEVIIPKEIDTNIGIAHLTANKNRSQWPSTFRSIDIRLPVYFVSPTSAKPIQFIWPFWLAQEHPFSHFRNKLILIVWFFSSLTFWLCVCVRPRACVYVQFYWWFYFECRWHVFHARKKKKYKEKKDHSRFLCAWWLCTTTGVIDHHRYRRRKANPFMAPTITPSTTPSTPPTNTKTHKRYIDAAH